MIEVKDIVKSYGNGESRFQALKGISLTVKEGDFVVILGASGSREIYLFECDLGA